MSTVRYGTIVTEKQGDCQGLFLTLNLNEAWLLYRVTLEMGTSMEGNSLPL
jgi:hypothetical protein